MRDLIIIGGGVIGLSVAYFAQRAGLSVTILDRNPPESDSCSTGNAGMDQVNYPVLSERLPAQPVH